MRADNNICPHFLLKERMIFKNLGLRAVAILSAIILLSISCKKEPEDQLGLDILPEDEQLGQYRNDSLAVIAHIERDDSIRMDFSSSAQLLGSYIDPSFGKVKSSIYTQFRLPSSNQPNFGDAPQLDSVVLSLKTRNHYGKIRKLGGYQTFRVYRVTEDMNDTIYSNETFTFDPTELGHKTLLAAPDDSITSSTGIKLDPQIRIKLDDAFGNELLTSTAANNDDFLQQFKGLFVTPDNPGQMTGEGAIIYLELQDTDSRLTVYFNNGDTVQKQFSYLINSDGNWSSLFEHDYSIAPDISAQLADSTLGQQQIFIHSMQGLRTRIYFPDLLDLPDKDQIVIHKAELILKLADDADRVFYPAPSGLTLARQSSSGTLLSLKDVAAGEGYFGGTITSSNEYRFNIAFYIQDLINGEYEDNGLYLLNRGNAVNANRCILQGPDESNAGRMKLVLTYSKL